MSTPAGPPPSEGFVTLPVSAEGLKPSTRLIPRWKRWLLIIIVFAVMGWYRESLWGQLLRPRVLAALQARNDAAAIIWLDRMDWLAPRDAEGAFLRARVQRHLGNMPETAEWLMEASRRGIPSERIEREKWLAFAQSGQMTQAEPHLRTLLTDAGDDGAEICEAFASGYLRVQRIEKAIPILDVWEADYPDDPRPYQLRGAYAQRQGDWSGAVIAYENALARDPTWNDVRVRLGRSLIQLRDYPRAEVALRECLERDPKMTRAWATLGELQLATGDWAAAEETFLQAMAVEPNDQSTRLGLGQIAIHREQYEQAIMYLEPAVRQDPQDRAPRAHLITALQRLGRHPAAAPHLEWIAKAVKADDRRLLLLDEVGKHPNNLDQRFELAELTYHYISVEEGLQWLIHIVDLAPQHTAARTILYEHFRISRPELAAKYKVEKERSP